MAECPIIRGMTFDSYDPDHDPSGEIGHAFAHAEFVRRGGFTLKEPADALSSLRGCDFERVVRLALTRLPPSAPDEEAGAFWQRKRLSQLRAIGYPLESYSRLNVNEVRAYFNRVVHEVGSLARRHCPDLLVHVAEENRRLEAEDELLR
ncbi:MAG: hypothetical protein AABX53_00770 [Nanoarchaeota archaeon]